MSPLDIVCPASTTIAAASGSTTFILLLRPATICRVPHLSTVCALVGLALGAECLCRIFSLHRCRCRRHLLALPLGVLIRQHFDHILRTQLCVAHLHVQNHVLEALRETEQQADRNVFVFHLGTDAAELGADVQDFIAVMQDVASFRHLDAEQLALEVDASRLLRPTIEHLQPRPRCPCFFTAVDHMVVVRVHVEQHQPERDVARLDVLI